MASTCITIILSKAPCDTNVVVNDVCTKLKEATVAIPRAMPR